MKLHQHIVSSTLVSGIVYLLFKSWNLTLACLLSGILIDVDHIYDYIREFGFPFKIKDFFNAHYNNELVRLTLVFHSWELLFLIGIIAWSTNWNLWITGILIGFGNHMALDLLYYKARLKTISFLWRWKNDFRYEVISSNHASNRRNPD